MLRRVGFSGLTKAPIDLEIFVKTPDARVLRNRQRLAVLSLGRNR